MSEHFWFTLLGLAGALGFVFVLAGFVYCGLALAWRGLQLLPPRTWRRVEARVRSAAVESEEGSYFVRVHYSFLLHRAGAEPRELSSDTIPHRSFVGAGRSAAEALAARILAARTIPIWYAESNPSLQYPSPPRTGWQALKGIASIALGLMCAGLPLLILLV